jgi:hypothetical protein
VKTFKLLFIVFLLGCEFRPPAYLLESHNSNNTKCNHPVTEIHNYNHGASSTITKCKYSSSGKIKEELTFDVEDTELIGMVTYQYKYTYYLKTVYDYVNGSQENHYVVGIYYINKN